MDVTIRLAYKEKEELIQLFKEYTESILAEGEEVIACLKSQHYSDEINGIAEKYGLPEGRLYIASIDNNSVGCIALRKVDEDYCEMKRLYVRPGNRGKHIGRKLMEQIISDAKEIGYKHIRLDTFPFMDKAIKMYKNYGFYEIERYNDNPAPTAVFMQLDIH
ncbi:GNAT family N-acetyltransferase [Clostridium coskatii]|uniref:N-acetyltransferase YsnE n=1 Tax=Clostridium coskatii TaxID=1705578 RepID=A0A162LET9_9CLOT|nr:GNAT family N-acetyltransferase [Clostridium coskatii]OAA92596.1 putative N-acetyltransferase YsnE [Clostridium coskatii]OBR91525.1 putative N-acetyltransferase YsnE [Clostridium coskatii]